MNNGIGVDPATVQNVANACRSIQSNLDEQVSSWTQQLSQLEGALQGPAANVFIQQFQKWQQLVHQMSDTLQTTSQTLDSIAQAANEQMAALRRLGGM